MTFAFIILHYSEQSLEYTKRCVTSILKIDKSNEDSVHVIVVDNASNDSSESVLKKYCFDIKIDLIVLKEPLGFAFPINSAYEFALEKYNPNLYISLNNDTEIVDFNFIEKLKLAYLKYNFDLMGTKIIDIKGNNQNPYVSFIDKRNFNIDRHLDKFLRNYKELTDNRKKTFFSMFRAKQIVKEIILRFSFLKQIIYMLRGTKHFQATDSNKIIENVALHGSAIIFSENYSKKFKYLFYPKKHFFIEEDILFYLIKKFNLKSIYNPDLTIKHYEDVSTDIMFEDKQFEKLKWKLDQSLYSLYEFRNLMEKQDKDLVI